MRSSASQFARSLRILACLSFLGLFTLPSAHAQITGGSNSGGNNTGGAGSGGGGTGDTGNDPLGFDAGVTLENRERTTRDTGTFVGAEAPSVGNFGAANQSGTGVGGRAGGGNQQGQFFNFFNQLNRTNQFNQSQQNQIRIPLRLGFAKPPAPANNPAIARQVGSTLSGRFASLNRFNQPINVVMQGGTAVLTGRVADAETSRIAERLAMLEPGVVSVQNELAIAPPVEPEVLPAPPPLR